MLIYIKLAIRNVHKNLRSISLNGLGIALTVIAVVFIFAFSRGIENQIVQRNIRFETGAVIVTLKKEITGYAARPSGDSVYSAITNLLDNDPSVSGYRERITVYNSMLYGNEGTQRIHIEGMKRTELPLLNEMVQVLKGDTDWDDISNGLLISTEVAEEAGLGLLDVCNMVVASADGTINMQDFVVTGIFLNTSQANRNRAYTPYAQAKSFYHTNLPNRLLVDVSNLDDAERVAAALSDMTVHPDVEIETYKDTIGMARALSGINRNGMSGMAFFLLFISFVGIWAMTTEHINGRQREIGTLLTFGFSRRAVRGIFLYESLYVSLMFCVAGLVVVAGVVGALQLSGGVYLGRLASFAFGSSTILPELMPADMLIAFALALLYPLIATWLSLRLVRRGAVVEFLSS